MNQRRSNGLMARIALALLLCSLLGCGGNGGAPADEPTKLIFTAPLIDQYPPLKGEVQFNYVVLNAPSGFQTDLYVVAGLPLERPEHVAGPLSGTGRGQKLRPSTPTANRPYKVQARLTVGSNEILRTTAPAKLTFTNHSSADPTQGSITERTLDIETLAPPPGTDGGGSQNGPHIKIKVGVFNGTFPRNGSADPGGVFMAAGEDGFLQLFDTDDQAVWTRKIGGPGDATVNSATRHPNGGRMSQLDWDRKVRT